MTMHVTHDSAVQICAISNILLASNYIVVCTCHISGSCTWVRIHLLKLAVTAIFAQCYGTNIQCIGMDIHLYSNRLSFNLQQCQLKYALINYFQFQV